MRTLAIWLALHLPAPASWRPWMLGAALGRRPQKVAAALLCLGLALPLAAQTQPDPFHLTPAASGGGGGGSGTVESVGLAAPADLFTVSGSPVTTTGTLTLTKATAAANTCYAGPVSGGAAAPTFRLLVAADIPTPLTSDTSGNAGTASAAASNPGNCSAGNLPRGVSATWTAEGCAPVNLATESTGAAPTATALAVDPANCGAGLLPRGVDAGGVAQGCAAAVLGTDTSGGYAASATAGGPASSVAANSVALGTDTTGGYAGSATEGGAATTATALAANGTNCGAGDAAAGVDAGGNAEGCFTPGGGAAPGSDTQVLFNDAGATGADAGLTYNKTTDTLATTVITSVGANANVVIDPNGTGMLAIGGNTSSDTALRAITWLTSPFLRAVTPTFSAGIGFIANALAVPNDTTPKFYMDSNGTPKIASDVQYVIASTTNAQSGTQDVGWGRVAAKVPKWTDGSTGLGWNAQWLGQCRVTSDQTNATTTFASTTCTISGLTAGRKYPFRCWFSLNQATAADGAKFDFQGGTAGETTFIASLTIYDTALALSSHPDDLTDSSAATTLTGRGHAEVWGDFVPSGSGTFIPRFAQNAATTGTLTLHAGSWCTMDDSP